MSTCPVWACPTPLVTHGSWKQYIPVSKDASGSASFSRKYCFYSTFLGNWWLMCWGHNKELLQDIICLIWFVSFTHQVGRKTNNCGPVTTERINCVINFVKIGFYIRATTILFNKFWFYVCENILLFCWNTVFSALLSFFWFWKLFND